MPPFGVVEQTYSRQTKAECVLFVECPHARITIWYRITMVGDRSMVFFYISQKKLYTYHPVTLFVSERRKSDTVIQKYRDGLL